MPNVPSPFLYKTEPQRRVGHATLLSTRAYIQHLRTMWRYIELQTSRASITLRSRPGSSITPNKYVAFV